MWWSRENRRQSSRLILDLPRLFRFLCIFLSVIISSSASTSAPKLGKNRSFPKWQTVFPDTGIVVPLFGQEGPHWQLDYEDTVTTSWAGGANDAKTTTTVIPQNLTARVPGDLVSDLMNNGIIQDPYWDGSLWQDQDQWLGPQRRRESEKKNKKPFDPCQKEQTRIWTYSTNIEGLENIYTSPDANHYSWQLVVESLQMGATLRWNEVFLANVTDQFLRYTFTINEKHLQGKTKHTLSVSFDPSIETDGRFMACAGGWDWAPYTLACNSQGRRIFSRGIVQPIYLIAVDAVAITHVVPKVYHLGDNNMKVNVQPDTANFKVSTDVYFEFAERQKNGRMQTKSGYSLVASADFTEEEYTHDIVFGADPADSKITMNMSAPRDNINLWWPNGMGAQPLYEIRVRLQRNDKDLVSNMNTSAQRDLSDRTFHDDDKLWITRQIGFRTSAVVTINETATKTDDDNDDGTGMHGMYLRVNGALVMARGANIIPADQLEGRYSFESRTNDLTYTTIVVSSAAAGMNMIRVWGGGKDLPQAFYNACNEHGILVYQDQMFVGDHRPLRTSTVQQEIQHRIRSLASHPSIVIWNGCNECQVVMGTETEIYATFVMQIVGEEDDTRSIWPSSPSMYGWKTGVHTYDSKPNGKPLATRNPSDHKGAPKLETHGPYQRAFSKTFPGVNGVDQHFPYPSGPNKLYEGDVGPDNPNHFASEFGSSVWSSFESLSATLHPDHWGLHGGGPPDKCHHLVGNANVCEGSNVMAQRNYPCDTLVEGYFGNSTSLKEVGESVFQAQLYQCIIAQTIWMKGEIESRRADNSFGILIWQLNENWPTGGWGVLEYSSTLPGQMLGGRWKPLMHLLERSLFTDVFAACGRSNECYVRNDGINAVNASVTLEAWNIQGSRNRCSVATHTFDASLKGGVSSKTRFQYPKEWTTDDFDTILVRVEATDSKVTLMADSPFLWSLPKTISNLVTTIVSITIESIKIDPEKTSATVTLSSDALALYVVLTTQASGRFDDNAFVLRPDEHKVISFLPLVKGGKVDIGLLKDSLRIEHLGQYFQ